MDRRDFLKSVGVAGGIATGLTSAVAGLGAEEAAAAHHEAGAAGATAAREAMHGLLDTVRKHSASDGVEAVFTAAPGAVAQRAYRGDLDLLPLRYSHSTPFSTLPGAPECTIAAADGSFVDPGVLDDGRNWYYTLATIGPDGVAGFGTSDRDGDGRPDFARPGPDAELNDLVVDLCP